MIVCRGARGKVQVSSPVSVVVFGLESGAARPCLAALQPGANPPPACALTPAANAVFGNVGSAPL